MNTSTDIIAVFWIHLYVLSAQWAYDEEFAANYNAKMMHLTIYFHGFHGHLNQHLTCRWGDRQSYRLYWYNKYKRSIISGSNNRAF